MAAQPWIIEDSPYFPVPAKYVGKTVNLLTIAELEALPSGTTVVSIQGKEKVTGTDDIDTDTRGGYTAWGIPA
jgi:hypothetical protein